MDTIGSRNSLIYSMFGSAAGYILLGHSWETGVLAINMIMISRFIVGIFKQTQTITKAAIALITAPEVVIIVLCGPVV